MSVNTWGITSADLDDKLERVNANSSCFRWTLEKFSTIDRSAHLCLLGRGFSATGSFVSWCMQLYPNGRSKKHNNDFITVAVDYLTSYEGITAAFELSMVNSDGEVVKDIKLKKENLKLVMDRSAPYPRYVDAGYYRFKLRRSDVENPENRLLKDDCLTISLDVTYSDPLVVPAISMKKEVRSSQEERLKEFGKLLENDEFSDVTFVIGDKKIRAHKAILAMQSPVFKAMFLHDMQEKEKNVVKIVDIEYEVLMELFRFMYTGAVGNIEKVACGLLVAAEKYCVERLKSLCEKTLWDNLKIDNVIYAFAAADVCNVASLKKQASDFILNHADEIVDRDEFTTLSPDLMRELFRAIVKKIPKESK